jgi:hypothetical protein
MAVPVHVHLPIAGMGGKSFIKKVGGYNVLTMAANSASPGQLVLKGGWTYSAESSAA